MKKILGKSETRGVVANRKVVKRTSWEKIGNYVWKVVSKSSIDTTKHLVVHIIVATIITLFH